MTIEVTCQGHTRITKNTRGRSGFDRKAIMFTYEIILCSTVQNFVELAC